MEVQIKCSDREATVSKRIMIASSHLTFSTAVAELWPAKFLAVQRYWPWFPGWAFETVSTDASTYTLSIRKKYNSVKLDRWWCYLNKVFSHAFKCFSCWPCRGGLWTFVHTRSTGIPPLNRHLKLTDSPWRTVAARGSTVTTGAWPATAHTERDRDNTHNLMPSAYLNLQTGLGKTQSKQTANPKQTTRANTRTEQECFWWQCKKKKKHKT